MGEPQSKLVSKTSHIIKLQVWLKKIRLENWRVIMNCSYWGPEFDSQHLFGGTAICNSNSRYQMFSSVLCGHQSGMRYTCIHSGKTLTPTHKSMGKKREKLFFKNCHSEYSGWAKMVPNTNLRSSQACTHMQQYLDKNSISHMCNMMDFLTSPSLQTWHQQILLPPSLPHPC